MKGKAKRESFLKQFFHDKDYFQKINTKPILLFVCSRKSNIATNA